MKKSFALIFMLFPLFFGYSQGIMILDEKDTIMPDKDIHVEKGDVPFAVIQEVPVFPGCEKSDSNSAKKKCMSDMIKNFVHSKFNEKLVSEFGHSGINRIYVRFKIDKSGTVVDIRARGPHPDLEKEAERVCGLLPKMIPGKQRGKPFGVLYSFPILLEGKKK
ncbi:energy transducer TonB [Aquimarina sp. AU58]|uniref:energy transducer TonB n=1 Tax=Aquimarina sp. AU58 TaxID=1874112 RepID=UPI000D64A878|nr:hypothetical protein [Aquimarina sp. AU58]